ncbi:MAG: hypothetical protein Q4A15_13010 [Prevotellaceae bacterium]|nr:hypothetical protein [Prevotellaceae bacterium]
MNKEAILVNTISAIIAIAFMEVVLHLIDIEVHHWTIVAGALIGVSIAHKQ